MTQQYTLFQQAEGSDKRVHPESPSMIEPTDVLSVCVDVFSVLPDPYNPVSIVVSGDIDADVQQCEDRLTDLVAAQVTPMVRLLGGQPGQVLTLRFVKSGGGLLVDVHSSAAVPQNEVSEISAAVAENLIWDHEVAHIVPASGHSWSLRSWVNLQPNQIQAPWLAFSDGENRLPFDISPDAFRSESTGLLIVLG